MMTSAGSEPPSGAELSCAKTGREPRTAPLHSNAPNSERIFILLIGAAPGRSADKFLELSAAFAPVTTVRLLRRISPNAAAEGRKSSVSIKGRNRLPHLSRKVCFCVPKNGHARLPSGHLEVLSIGKVSQLASAMLTKKHDYRGVGSSGGSDSGILEFQPRAVRLPGRPRLSPRHRARQKPSGPSRLIQELCHQMFTSSFPCLILLQL